MLDFPRWKVFFVSLVVLAGILLAVPSLVPKSEVEKWPAWVPSPRINLGLDIAGGSQLLLEADTADAAKQRLQAMEDTVTTELRRGEPRIAIGDVSTSGGRLSFVVRDPTQHAAAFDRMQQLTQPVALTGTRDWEISTVDGNRIVLTPTESGAKQALANSLTVARDVVDPNTRRAAPTENQSGNERRGDSDFLQREGGIY